MNIFLIEEKVPFLTLPVTGDSASHIINILNASEGDEIDIGVQNGPTGKAVVTSITGEELQLVIKWNEIHTNDLYPVALLVGLSRPQTCRKILEQARIIFMR